MSKEQILKHIKAARLWLDRAQSFVEDNNIIRGLSFLFLASAETQLPLRESQKAEKTDKKEAKKPALLKPAYGMALAAGLTFVVALAGWKLLYKEQHLASAVKIERISASEFVNKLRESNEREENKAFSMLENTLDSFLQESSPVTKQPSKWVAYQTLRKVKPLRRRAEQETKVITSPASPSENFSHPQPAETVTSVPNTSSVTSDEDLIGLVKIAEKTLKGQ